MSRGAVFSTILSLGVVAAGLTLSPTSVAAQDGDLRYVPISSWATPWIEHLIRGGVLRDPDPLTRPLARGDLARALADVDTGATSPASLRIVELLRREVAASGDSARWAAEAHLGGLAASDARRWALRPAVDSARVFPQGGLALSLELPHLALVTHPHIDNRLKYDPDYAGKKDRFVAGRNDEAYLRASWRYLDVFFGIVDRNWGSPEIEGLLLSPWPYGVDHLMLRLGPRRLRLELGATQLDALPLWDSQVPVRRYLSLHRLVARPSERLSFSLFEAAVYAQSGGVGRAWEPWYLNPVNLFLVAQFDGAPTSNALLGADVHWRARGSLAVFGQFYLDDVQVDKKTQGDLEPPGYGLTVAATGGLGAGAASWSALYTRVTNLAYRTPAREETYTLRGVGIARNFSDYDQASARLTAVAAPRLLLTGELTLLRQGEGDMRIRYPAESLFATTPTIFSGVVERTVRVAAGASWVPLRGVSLAAELGYHAIANSGHVDGRSDHRWVWRVSGRLSSRWEGALRW